MPGCALLDFLASLSSDWRPLVIRLFFAARPGHAPVAHKRTWLRGLLLMHINQHGSLMGVTSHSPTVAEDWKIKILFAIKRSLESWEKHRFQPKGAVLSDFQAAFNLLTSVTSEKYCDSVLKPDHEIKSELNWSYSASKKGNKIITLKIKNPSYCNIFFCDFSASRALGVLCYIYFLHSQI